MTSDIYLENDSNISLKFAWWNSALSPTKASDRANNDEIATAVGIILLLLNAGVAFMAFGETSSNDIDKIKLVLKDKFPNLEVLDKANRAGKSRFGTMIIYRKDVFEFVSSSDLVVEIGNRTSRIAQHFIMGYLNSEEVFHIFVSHWPSRSRGDSIVARDKLAMLLNDKVVSLIKDNHGEKIILMGDYNDEPFDRSITEYLLASRDRDVVSASKHMVYNPFWKHLYTEKADSDLYYQKFPGTYYYKSDDKCKWRTFDQIMVSPSLVSGCSGWVIDEMKTSVLAQEDLVDLITRRNFVFDHLPIVGVIERVVK